MNNYLDNLRNAPTPLAVVSRIRLIEAIKRAHIEVLKSALHLEDIKDISSSIPPIRRYTLWLEEVSLSDEIVDSSEREELCNLAATLYEFVGSLTQNNDSLSIFHPPLNDLLRSAVLSSFTPYQAHASLISKRVRQQIDNYTSNSPSETCHKLTALIVVNLLARDFHTAFLQSHRLNAVKMEAIEELKRLDVSNTVYFQLDRAIAIGRVCGNISLGMLVGIPKVITDSLERLDLIKERALQSQDSQHYWIADRLRRVGEQMFKSSMHRILGHAEISEAYRYALARDRYFELWNPQLRAIEQGLLDNNSKHCIVSIPTGAGKTLFAEMSILAALRGREQGERWAIYVAPSRALVNQVSSDLRHRLDQCDITVRTVIAGAEQSFILDDELELIRMNRTVTVTTPEKLDAYYRNAKEVFESCCLIIFDEAHKIAETERGPLIESLITRFLTLQPKTRILLLSGMMSNVDELKAWLGKDNTIAVQERRRATRQVFGIAVRHAPFIPGQEKPRKAKKGENKQNGDIFRSVRFSGGFVIVHEKDDLRDELEINLPNVFHGYYEEKFLQRTNRPGYWVEDRSRGRSSANDHAIATAEKIVRAPGTILVFVQRVAEAERCCRDFNMPIDIKVPESTIRLASFLRAELGEDHPLATYCLKGYAYHHSRLPNIIQRAIELALERGWLKAVFATSTLREGINSSATTVIISGNTSYYDENKQQQDPISEIDFLNLAGRAGRPYVDTEGRILFIPNSLEDTSVAQVGRKYILAGDSALRIQSQLKELANALNQNQENNLLNFSSNQQSFLLAIEAADIANKEGITEFLQRTLWSLQEDDSNILNQVFHKATSVLEETRNSIGDDNFKMASRLGLSLTSAERLILFLSTHLSRFDANFTDMPQKEEQRRLILNIALEITEIRKGTFKDKNNPEEHFESLDNWINGASYKTILEIGRKSNVIKEKGTIADAVRYASDISTWLSWAFGAASSVITYLLGEANEYLGILPLLIRYGVPTASAAYISLLGVTDRVAAQKLGQAFEMTGRSITISEISDWLRTIEPQLDAILAEEDHGLRTELVKRQILRERFGSRSAYRISRFRGVENIETGTILSCRASNERIILLNQDKIVGEILEAKSILLSMRRDQEEFLGIPLDPIVAGNVGKIALIHSNITPR